MSGFSSFKVPKILYLHGVFLEDCKQIADVLEERLMEENEDIVEPELVVHERLPHTYRGIDTWVKSCSLKCFYCGIFFDTVPLFIPKSIQKIADGTFTMPREGCFHSWPCAIKWIKREYPKYADQNERIDLVLFLYGDMTKRQLKSIPSNINKYDMDCYGGFLTPLEWVAKINKLMHATEKAAGYHKNVVANPALPSD